VYLLRWYWWRVNAWSEIAAMSTALIVSLAMDFTAPFRGSEPVAFAKQTLLTTAVTTAVWVAVTLLTPAEPRETLERFYRRVRPDSRGWKPVARMAPEVVPNYDLGRNFLHWIVGCAMVYCALFGIGHICLLSMRFGVLLLGSSLGCAAFLYRGLSRTLHGANSRSGASPE